MSENSCSLIEEDQYEVQKILSKRTIKGRTQYKIKWLGWERPEDQTWQPIDHLQNVRYLVHQFEERERMKKIQPKTKQISKDYQSPHKLNKLQDEEQILQLHDLESPQPKKRKSRLKKKSQISNPQFEFSSPNNQPENDRTLENYEITRQQSAVQNTRNQAANYPYVYFQKNKEEIPPDYQIGNINYFLLGDGNKIFYDIDIVNENNQCVGVKKVASDYLRTHAEQKLAAFLQDYLMDYYQADNKISELFKKGVKYNTISKNQYLWKSVQSSLNKKL